MDTHVRTSQERLMRKATMASVVTAIFLIVIKLASYLLSGSVALLSSLVDSVLDLLSSIVNFIAVRHSLEPADEEHRFGHGKAEPLAGLAQAAFITGSSLFLIFEAIFRLLKPYQIDYALFSIIVMCVSLVATILLVSYQQYVVRETQSVAVKADSIHYLSDVLLNLAVIAALVLSQMGFLLADPIFALLIAAYILKSAWHVARQSFDQLMDRELPDGERDKIRTLATSNPLVTDIHGLRTRLSGRDMFIQLHLEMDGGLSLHEAHRISEEVQNKIQMAYPNADVIIHEDPDDLNEEHKF